MEIIYLVGKSLFNTRVLEIYFRMCKLQAQDHRDVAIVFLQDGVLIAARGNSFERQLLSLKRAGVRIYFRKEDLLARGIQEEHITPAGETVSLKQIMEMLAIAPSIVSVL